MSEGRESGAAPRKEKGLLGWWWWAGSEALVSSTPTLMMALVGRGVGSRGAARSAAPERSVFVSGGGGLEGSVNSIKR